MTGHSPSSNSLLQLELVQVALSDPATRWTPRPIDANWLYRGILPQSMTGFNPSTRDIYYAECSATSSWLKSPHASTRDFNAQDWLVREVLFGIHDYLHGFAYRVIQQSHPELHFGIGPILSSNFETHVFLHLLTEAVATVGLDYWYISTFDLEKRLRIGTNMRSLTVSYHLFEEDEYKQFHPELAVQEPGFLRRLCDFYCSGEFLGFDLTDVQHSPKLMRWLSHEITYGEEQRRYVRQWFAHLAHDDIRLRPGELGAPVICNASWKDRLIDEMATMLWALVKEGQRPLWGVRVASDAWASPTSKSPDFRFINVGAVELEQLADEIEAGWHTKRNATFAFDQYIFGFEMEAMNPELRAMVPMLRDKADLKLTMQLLRNERRLATPKPEPRDVFLLG